MGRSYAITVDLHAHALIVRTDELARADAGFGRELEQRARGDGEASSRHNLELFVRQYRAELTELPRRLAAMDAMGIDVQAVSLSPTQYHYWADPELARALVRAANEGLAELCASSGGRLVPLATVALQHPELAVEQLQHAVRELGARGVQISTRIAEHELDDPRFDPFWRCAEELAVVVFIHPLGCSLGPRLAQHYLSNVIGQPIETTIALSRLIWSGVLDRFPELRLCAAHGGGYLPYYLGRSEHAYRVRPESRLMQRSPREYLRRIWFDSLVYEPQALRQLVSEVGATQVVIGTDFPFDMGVRDPLERLEAVPDLSDAERAAIAGGNATSLLRCS
jgi:aminocarboxymuconate-semialdehyde decarboxylase